MMNDARDARVARIVGALVWACQDAEARLPARPLARAREKARPASDDEPVRFSSSYA